MSAPREGAAAGGPPAELEPGRGARAERRRGAAKSAEGKKRPWRDNLEAIAMSLIVVILMKYFVIEAYTIPTGSMQPTLMGNDDSGIHDRILVDKLSFHFRDPERFEVTVFRYPLDRSKSFIKRVIGMPGEELDIREGDVWVRPSGEDWRVLRRPRPIQRETWRRLELEGEWESAGSRGWRLEGERILADGPGGASFPRTRHSVQNHYADGYPPKMAALLKRRPDTSGRFAVGDLRIEGEVTAEAGTSAVELELREGERRYVAVLPGPAAPEEARPRLSIEGLSGEALEIVAEKPWRMRAGRAVDFGFQNLDDLVELELDGEPLLALEVPPASDQRSRILLRLAGGGGRFGELRAFRDIHYTTERVAERPWQIPEGHYFMLGDNTQDSEDSRLWQLELWRLEEGELAGETLRGNYRGNENPRRVRGEDGQERIFLHDLYGERYVFAREQGRPLGRELAPFVPRELFTGRALLVFWPIAPSLDVYRLRWIR